jgi:hypothetical protein
MICELMLTYDTPALLQTGNRNVTGPNTLHIIIWVLFEWRGQSINCGNVLSNPIAVLLYPAPPEGVMLFYLCPSFRPLSFGRCIVCPSIYGFWLSLRFPYIQYDDAVSFSGRTDNTTAKRQRTEGQTIQRPTDKGRKDRQYNGQKTKDGRTDVSDYPFGFLTYSMTMRWVSVTCKWRMIYGILRCIFCPQIPRDDYLCYDDINKC